MKKKRFELSYGTIITIIILLFLLILIIFLFNNIFYKPEFTITEEVCDTKEFQYLRYEYNHSIWSKSEIIGTICTDVEIDEINNYNVPNQSFFYVLKKQDLTIEWLNENLECVEKHCPKNYEFINEKKLFCNPLEGISGSSINFICSQWKLNDYTITRENA